MVAEGMRVKVWGSGGYRMGRTPGFFLCLVEDECLRVCAWSLRLENCRFCEVDGRKAMIWGSGFNSIVPRSR